ncbi:hypothetical protein BMJ20_31555 [Sinorhizobium medicae]|nr:hypothetical protein BMJ20_31555 [Sinorhizobium medicae]
MSSEPSVKMLAQMVPPICADFARLTMLHGSSGDSARRISEKNGTRSSLYGPGWSVMRSENTMFRFAQSR